MRGRRTTLGAVGVLVLAGVIGAACGRTPGTSSGAFRGKPAASPAAAAPVAGPARGAATNPTGQFAAGSATESASALAAAVPALQQRVVKTAALSLSVRDGMFDDRIQRATQVAAGNGGYVSSSQTVGGKLRSGTLVIRVPVDQFEAALGQLKALGRITSVQVSGHDVTATFVDLQARLRNWQAQETILLGLMKKSASIEDSIRVENQLSDVQLNIEEITGQLRVLNDQAGLSTITLSIAEAGAVRPRPRPVTGLAKAWRDARHGFVAVVSAVVVGLGYLLPLGLLGAFGAMTWAVARRPRSVRTGASTS